jgi:hypothetical protein
VPCISSIFPEVHKGGLVSNTPVDQVARIELVGLLLTAQSVELSESIRAVVFAHRLEGEFHNFVCGLRQVQREPGRLLI